MRSCEIYEKKIRGKIYRGFRPTFTPPELEKFEIKPKPLKSEDVLFSEGATKKDLSRQGKRAPKK